MARTAIDNGRSPAVHVASRIETNRRRETLSWEVHSEAADLPHDQMDDFLNRAEAEIPRRKS